MEESQGEFKKGHKNLEVIVTMLNNVLDKNTKSIPKDVCMPLSANHKVWLWKFVSMFGANICVFLTNVLVLFVAVVVVVAAAVVAVIDVIDSGVQF